MRVYNEYMSETICYGGLPVRRGDAYLDLQKFAQSQRKDNWMPLRDAGIMGLEQGNRLNPRYAPNDEPLSLTEFYGITGIKR